MMRAIIITIAAWSAACDRPGGRPGPPSGGGVVLPPVETGTGEDRPRLDLGDWPALDMGGGVDLGLPQAETSTGEAPGDSSGTSTGAASTGTTTGTTGGGTTGEAPGSSSGEPLPACPCTPEAAAAKNVCGLPPGACEPTAPGGYCDPDGDGSYADGDWVLGWQHWTALCA